VRALSLALALAACAETSGFPPGTGAIVDQELIDRATCGRLGAHGEGAWTPTERDIEQLEAVLMARLAPELERDAEFYGIEPHAPGDYYRRYAGVSVRSARLIAICGEDRRFYDERGIDWRTDATPFRDGGSNSFGAYYDPVTREITYFEFGYVA
jgi:hypothetical protein